MALSNTKDGGRVIFGGSAPGRSTPSRQKGPLTGERGQIAEHQHVEPAVYRSLLLQIFLLQQQKINR